MQNITPCLFALFLTNLCLQLSSAYKARTTLCCNTGNYTINSTYSTNLETLSSSFFTAAVAKQGFYENTIGTAPNQISGLVLCRGDVDSSICSDCLNQSFQDVMNLCPYSKEATIYYDLCLFSYSNHQFLNSTKNWQLYPMWNIQNMTGSRFSGWDPSNNTIKYYFLNVMNTLLSNVSDQAAYNSRKRFGTGVINITASSLPVIYGLSQCTPDFSNNTCRACLQGLIDLTLNYFDGQKGGRILGVRCNLRYEIYNFFSGKPDQQIGSISWTIQTPPASFNLPIQPPTMNSTSSTSKGGKRTLHLIIIVSVSVTLLIIGCFIGFFQIRKLRYAESEIIQNERKLATNNETLDLWSREGNSDISLINFNQIVNATGGAARWT
ncbi:antimicrobial ginkbilobin-2-like protein [Carex rostrata]